MHALCVPSQLNPHLFVCRHAHLCINPRQSSKRVEGNSFSSQFSWSIGALSMFATSKIIAPLRQRQLKPLVVCGSALEGPRVGHTAPTALTPHWFAVLPTRHRSWWQRNESSSLFLVGSQESQAFRSIIERFLSPPVASTLHSMTLDGNCYCLDGDCLSAPL